MPFGPATNRQATGWVTVRRPTCSVITDTLGDCDGGATGDALGDGIGDGIGDELLDEDGLGLAVGIGVLLQAAMAITAAKAARLRRMKRPSRETSGYRHDGQRSRSVARLGWVATRRRPIPVDRHSEHLLPDSDPDSVD